MVPMCQVKQQLPQTIFRIGSTGRGPTGLRTHGRNQGQLEFRSHVVPKTAFQDGGEVYTQNDHFGLICEMIYQFLSMEAKNYKFGMFCQQCHPTVAPGDANIQPRNASQIHICHLFTS